MRAFAKQILAVILLSFVFVTPSGYGLTGRAEMVNGAISKRLDQHLTRLATFGFSGSVLVAKDGKPILQKSYGLANRERAIPVTEATVFDVASITKQFTATAILQLEEAGKLKVTDPLNKFFPDLPKDKQAITLHHLLTHTSGLPGVVEGETPTRNIFLRRIFEARLNAEPGTRYAYSNAGYTILAALIEILSGGSYEAFLRERLFAPAGLTNTGFYEDKEKWPDGAVAHGYDDLTDKGAPTSWKPDYKYRGSSYVLTSATDLYKWEQALAGERILSKAAKQKFFHPHVQSDIPGAQYAYGWSVDRAPNGTKRISHDGIGFGFGAVYSRYVEAGLVVIVVTNQALGRFLPMVPLQNDLWAIVMEGKSTELPNLAAPEAERLADYVGTYELPEGGRFTTLVAGSRLIMSAEGQGAIDLLSGADSKERKQNADFNARAQAVFEGISKGEFSAALREMAHQGTPDELKQMLTAYRKRFTDRLGEFRSIEVLGTIPETEATMTYLRLNFEKGSDHRRIRWENGKLAFILLAAFPLIPTTLASQSATEFYGYHLGLARLVQFRFERNAEQQITGLRFQTGGNKALAQKVVQEKR